MAIKGKYIWWSVGIATGLVTIGLLVYRNRKSIKDTVIKTVAKAKQTAESWLKPVTAKISSSFGYRVHPKTGVKQFHNGIDLPVPVGTKVKSPLDGVVENVYSNKEGGNQVIIKHSNGYQTGYAHLSKVQVKKGDKVKKGDVFALSGNTGLSTGPHVHLTLRDATGKLTDPAKIFFA